MPTLRTLIIWALIVAGAVVLALLASCASSDRQWRESQIVLERLPR